MDWMMDSGWWMVDGGSWSVLEFVVLGLKRGNQTVKHPPDTGYARLNPRILVACAVAEPKSDFELHFDFPLRPQCDVEVMEIRLTLLAPSAFTDVEARTRRHAGSAK
jgi:hypothetical protein